MQGVSRQNRKSLFRKAAEDVVRSLVRWRIWMLLAWNDIATRYRRSIIGPFWITLQTLVMTVALGGVYGRLFNMNVTDLLPYLSAGLIIWGFLSNLILEGAVAFSHSEPYLKQAGTPKGVFLLRVVVRQIIILMHNAVILVGVVIWAGSPVGASSLMAVFGLLLVACAGLGVVMGIAVIGARFRDVAQMTQSLLQVAFFLTPVMWKPDMLSGLIRDLLVVWNPLAVMIEVVRSPLLGIPVAPHAWMMAGGVSVLSLTVGFSIFAAYRHRITYWL